MTQIFDNSILGDAVDCVLAVGIDGGESLVGILPVWREAEHLGEQAFGFERQPAVPEMVVAHIGAVALFRALDNGHEITPFTSSR